MSNSLHNDVCAYVYVCDGEQRETRASDMDRKQHRDVAKVCVSVSVCVRLCERVSIIIVFITIIMMSCACNVVTHHHDAQLAVRMVVLAMH